MTGTDPKRPSLSVRVSRSGAEAPHVRICLSSSPENVALVRRAICGLAQMDALTRAETDAIKMAVSEACNNASLHAYGAGVGPLEVQLEAGTEHWEVAVRDRGSGVGVDAETRTAFPQRADATLSGVGLPAINALARDVRWSHPEDGGTLVEMQFETSSPEREPSDLRLEVRPPARERGSQEIEVAMAPFPVARAVLPRVLGPMAARASFSRDGHASLERIFSFLAASPSVNANAGSLETRIVAKNGELELSLASATDGKDLPLDDAMCQIERELDTSAVRLSGGAKGLHVSVERSLR